MSGMIYMDNAATTEMLPEVRRAMEPFMGEEYANASTAYETGKKVREAIEASRERIAHAIGARPKEIFFTSGGSESDNWVIKNAGKRHIITTNIEHPAVLRTCEYMEGGGCEVTYLPVDEKGLVRAFEVLDAVREDTSLVSIMTGNNEVGTIEPIADIGAMLRQKGIPFHTDAVQAVGQIPINVRSLHVDYLSASAHKFHGPKGVGFLYVRRDKELPSFIHGGSQERGKRAGTENAAGIVGMAEALTIASRNMHTVTPRIARLRNHMIKRVFHEIPEVRLNGHETYRLPGNINFSFRGVEATALLVLLEEDGIFASAGSACSTGKRRVSHVIEALKVPEDYAAGSVRFTLGQENTVDEVDAVVECLKSSVELLRG